MTEDQRRIASDHDRLIAQLANMDEASELGDSDMPADSAVKELKAELETLLSDVRQSPPVDEFENESGCHRALEMIRAIGQDPSFTGGQPGAQIAAAGEDLGSLREYQLISMLGQGGMGTVYKALHTKLDKIVALKVLPTDKLRDEHAVARFEREMKAVGRLEHPNIVRATDAGEIDGKHFLVMEHVDGLDLSTVVRNTGPLRVADACEIIRQSAIGLQHAYEHGLVHRDIKPSNLMLQKVQGRESRVKGQKQPLGSSGSGPSTLDSQPSVKILDMGLALLEEHRLAEQRDLTTTGQMMGTLDYMAPEQGADSHEVDIRADIYSLGATLFKLLCGEAPFSGPKYKTPMHVMLAIARDPAPSIADRRDDVPAELAAVVDRMLQKNPDDRFATPQEVATAMEPFVGDCDLASLLDRAESETAVDTDESLGRTDEYLSAPSTETKDDDKQPARAKLNRTNRLEKTQLAKTLPTSKSSSQKRPLIALGVALALAGIVAAAIVIQIMTDKGELIVRSEDDNVQVTVKRHNGEPVEDIELTKGQGHTTLRSGKYEVIISGVNADQFKITPRVVALSRNGSEVVTIERKSITDNERPVRSDNSAVTKSVVPNLTPADFAAEREAAKWVLSVGGEVFVSVAGDESQWLKGTADRPWARFDIALIDDITKLPDHDFLLTFVSLRYSKTLQDEDFAKLGRLKSLRGIDASYTKITNNAVKCFAGMTTLRYVALVNTAVRDDGFEHFSRSTLLELSIRETSDAGLAHIANQKQLRSLTIASNGEITDDGLRHLSDLRELESLHLEATQVTDAGLVHLAKLTLTLLVLRHSKVTGSGFMHLTAMPLTTLSLKDTKTLDLSALATFRGLRNLHLDNTSVTDEQMHHLRDMDVWSLVLGDTQVSDVGIVALGLKQANTPGAIGG